MRPYLVKEEKILLIAKESGEYTDILNAIKQIINNCIVTDIDINRLAIFDLEYLFAQLRGISVDNSIKLSLVDEEDGENYDFEFDVSEIKVDLSNRPNSKIMINKTTGLTLIYPSASFYTDEDYVNEKDTNKKIQIFLTHCIDTVFTEDDLFKIDDTNRNELFSFLDDLDLKTYQKLLNFIDDIPSIKYVLNYTNKKGNAISIALTKLSDFFIL